MRTKTALTRVFGTVAATAVAAGLTAVAAPAAGADTQAPVNSCTTTVAAPIGAKVMLNGEAVAGHVKTGAKEADRFLQFTYPDNLAEEIGKHTLEVGTVPDKATGVVGGERIAAAVTEVLDGNPALGWPSKRQEVLDAISNKVAGNCGMPIEATNHSAPTSARPQQPQQPEQGGAPNSSQPAPGQPSGAERGVPATPESPQGSGDAYAAPRNYGDIPSATAPTEGSAVPPDMRYSPQDGVPGAPDSPEYGVLGNGGMGNGGTRDGSKTGGGDVRNAGNADALAAESAAPGQVQLPMLLAVVALAGVTAALVRTWVLRKTV